MPPATPILDITLGMASAAPESSVPSGPLLEMAPFILLVVAGLILWVAGRRILRVALGFAGFVGGLGAGLVIASKLLDDVNPWLPGIVLGLLVACMAILTTRLAVAALLGVVGMVAGPAVVLTTSELRAPEAETSHMDSTSPDLTAAGEDDSDRGAFDELEEFFLDKGSPDAEAGATDSSDAPPSATGSVLGDAAARQLPFGDQAQEHLAEARTIATRVREQAARWWDEIPTSLRPILIGAMVTGALCGLLLGTVLPAFATSMVTAFGGSLMWLGGASTLVATPLANFEMWPPTATQSVLIWFAVSILGVLIQWMNRPKNADKQA